jgi:hypothetical protein
MTTKLNCREIDLQIDVEANLIEMAAYSDNGDALSEQELEDLYNQLKEAK